jgi:hypothetical protein
MGAFPGRQGLMGRERPAEVGDNLRSLRSCGIVGIGTERAWI